MNPLSPRETEVLVLVANGKTSKEIAVLLGIAFKTVVCHRDRIHCKLHLRNAADVALYAARNGLVNLDEQEQKVTTCA